MVAAIPQPASAQVLTCAVNDRACLLEVVAYLQQILASYSNTAYIPVTTQRFGTVGLTTTNQRTELNRLWNRLDDLNEEAADVFADGYDTDEATELLDDAADTLFAADEAIRRNNFRTETLLREARELLDEAEDELNQAQRYRYSWRNNDRDDAREAIADAKDALRDAEEEIEDAEDDGDDINDAYDFLKDAEDLIDDAEDAYDDRDYDEAIDFVEDAERAIRDALDEIEYDRYSRSDRDRAEDRLDWIEDFYQDVLDEVERADRRGERVRDAYDFLEEAEDLINDAEDAIDDRDYDEALDLLEEAEDAIDDAFDEL